VDTASAAIAALPAEALLFGVGALRFGTDVLAGIGSAVRFTEGVTSGDQGNRLLVVHRHAGECLANVARGGERIRLAIRPFGIHVDQAHLHRAEWVGELPLAAVALVSEPRVLGPPVDLVGFPDVLAAATKAERLEPHRFQGTVAGEDHQVRP